ncbi:MAG: hypothetical protein OEY64_02040 [Nitrospinota bacterium]|nr:hypothetical protein [Nitrospinota bacterium]
MLSFSLFRNLERYIPFIALAFLLFSPHYAGAEQNLSPYLKVGVFSGNVDAAATGVKEALLAGNFKVLGEYKPEDSDNMRVIAYTRDDLIATVLKVKDRGLLAAALKVGIISTGGKTEISMVNPEYLFRGYLMSSYKPNNAQLSKVASDVKAALGKVGSEFTPFGGSVSTSDLEHYHYMFGMEYFDNPVLLGKFQTFQEGLAKIESSLSANKGGVKKVYSIVDESSQTAVFGVALTDPDRGEKFFLPIIGESHLAALPYEFVLQGNKATMLHGRFRIAIHWPALTMVTFTKIITTPDAINDMLENAIK